MPKTAATGVFAGPKERLRNSLAACYFFRNWFGSVLSVSEAAKRIYLDALPTPPNGNAYTVEDWQRLRPFALVYITELDMIADAAPGHFHTRGGITIELEQNIPEQIKNDPGEIDRQFDNRVGNILFTGQNNEPGLWDLSAVTERGYFAIKSVSKDGPHRTPENMLSQIGDASIYWLHFTWGVDR